MDKTTNQAGEWLAQTRLREFGCEGVYDGYHLVTDGFTDAQITSIYQGVDLWNATEPSPIWVEDGVDREACVIRRGYAALPTAGYSRDTQTIMLTPPSTAGDGVRFATLYAIGRLAGRDGDIAACIAGNVAACTY